jgi:hypothetical protein
VAGKGNRRAPSEAISVASVKKSAKYQKKHLEQLAAVSDYLLGHLVEDNWQDGAWQDELQSAKKAFDNQEGYYIEEDSPYIKIDEVLKHLQAEGQLPEDPGFKPKLVNAITTANAASIFYELSVHNEKDPFFRGPLARLDQHLSAHFADNDFTADADATFTLLLELRTQYAIANLLQFPEDKAGKNHSSAVNLAGVFCRAPEKLSDEEALRRLESGPYGVIGEHYDLDSDGPKNQYQNRINEILEVLGGEGDLQTTFPYNAFRKSMLDWLENIIHWSSGPEPSPSRELESQIASESMPDHSS